MDGFLVSIGGILFCLNTCAGFVEQAKGFEMEAIAGAVIGGTLLTGGWIHHHSMTIQISAKWNINFIICNI